MNYTLHTCLVLRPDKPFNSEEAKENFNKAISNPVVFRLDGSEEQLVRKIVRNTLAVIAKSKSIRNNTDMEEELKKLLTKYVVRTA